ncbi:MAG: thiamine pyrophosphate-binding protein [Deltaproteobacteria bacterium]
MSAAVEGGVDRAREFVRELLAHGFDFFTGVPCSLVGPVIAELEPHGYVPETREDAALGLAAGAAFAGRMPLVLMQNSGFGVSINAIGSLQSIYAIPCLLLVTWRGFGGKDAPEHLVMGKAMPRILDAIEMPWRTIEVDAMGAAVAWARRTIEERPGPVALVVPPGMFA